MIDPRELDRWRKLSNETAELENKFTAHLQQCIEEIISVFDLTIDWWDYAVDSWDSVEEGSFNISEWGDEETIAVRINTKGKETVRSKEWGNFEYYNAFPLKFLFFTPKEVRNFVSAELEKHLVDQEIKKQKDKEKRKERKDKQQKLIEAVKNKLTLAEKKAIGLK